MYDAKFNLPPFLFACVWLNETQASNASVSKMGEGTKPVVSEHPREEREGDEGGASVDGTAARDDAAVYRSRVYWKADYLTYAGSGFSSSLRMFSTRTLNTECTCDQFLADVFLLEVTIASHACYD
jgi:hypothetical protein